VALYRRVNTYPRLLEGAVLGSPDKMDEHSLHEAARQIVNHDRSEPLAKAFARFERYRDTARVSSDPKQIMQAAWEGRVADLLFSRDSALRGAFTREMGHFEVRDDGEDLLNTAAMQTIAHKGQAFELRASEMPVPAEVVAVLRF
jgi:hypothetical protein